MNNQRDEILQHLITKYPYIEYASLFSDQAELINQPVGHWLEEQEENLELMVGKILYVFQELSTMFNKNEIEQEKIEQIWLKQTQSNIIFVRCQPDVFLVIKTNDRGFLGELRKVVDVAAQKIRKSCESEEIFSLDSGNIPLETQDNFVNKIQPNISEETKLNLPEQPRGRLSGKLRGRDFIEDRRKPN